MPATPRAQAEGQGKKKENKKKKERKVFCTMKLYFRFTLWKKVSTVPSFGKWVKLQGPETTWIGV